MVIDLTDRRKSMAVPVLPDTSHETIQRYVMGRLGVVVHTEGQWWQVGELGAWVPMPSARIWAEIQAVNGLETLEGAGSKGGGKCIRVTAGMCESVEALARMRFADPAFFEQSPAHGFVSPRGLWECSRESGWTCRAPTPEDRVRLWVGVDPDMERDPECWSSALHRAWGHESDYEARVALLHEFFGSTLTGHATRYQVALILVGGGENGKSVIVDVGNGMVPKVLRCSVTPDDLENNPFAASNLVGKALNSVPELPGGELLTSHRIKAVIDGSEQRGEQKYKDGFSFRPVAGHIFAANSLPQVRDLSHGFWRRWRPLTFTAPKITPVERRPNLAQEILASELAQILGYAMRYYAAMIAAGRGYTHVPSADAAAMAWRECSDSVQAWVSDACEPGGPSAFRGLYEHYRRHAEDAGSRPVGSKTFAQRLDALGHPEAGGRAVRMRGLAVRVMP